MPELYCTGGTKSKLFDGHGALAPCEVSSGNGFLLNRPTVPGSPAPFLGKLDIFLMLLYGQARFRNDELHPCWNHHKENYEGDAGRCNRLMVFELVLLRDQGQQRLHGPLPRKSDQTCEPNDSARDTVLMRLHQFPSLIIQLLFAQGHTLVSERNTD